MRMTGQAGQARTPGLTVRTGSQLLKLAMVQGDKHLDLLISGVMGGGCIVGQQPTEKLQ
jgi:hypothetical protein